MEELLISYISPTLLFMVVVLYGLGLIFKRAGFIPDKFIPLILAGVGVLLCCLYEFAVLGFSLEAAFDGIVQGILVSAVSVFGDQVIKQLKKVE